MDLIQPGARAIAVKRIADPHGSVILGQNQWQGQLQLALPLGDAPLSSGKQNAARIWLWLLKGF